ARCGDSVFAVGIVLTELLILIRKVILLLTVLIGRAESIGALFFGHTAAGLICTAEAAGQRGVTFTSPDRLRIGPAAVGEAVVKQSVSCRFASNGDGCIDHCEVSDTLLARDMFLGKNHGQIGAI